MRFARLSPADIEAGEDLLALGFGWPPSEAERMEPSDFVRFAKLAAQKLKSGAG